MNRISNNSILKLKIFYFYFLVLKEIKNRRIGNSSIFYHKFVYSHLFCVTKFLFFKKKLSKIFKKKQKKVTKSFEFRMSRFSMRMFSRITIYFFWREMDMFLMVFLNWALEILITEEVSEKLKKLKLLEEKSKIIFLMFYELSYESC